jgi:hypothetical protein
VKRGIIMAEYVNKAIACTIYNCANHCSEEEYCALKKIQVGTHENHPDHTECTDCQSFKERR